MDYKIVAEILRELNVDLRNGLNTEETLAYLKDLGTPEKNYVRCILQTKGTHPANDEILHIVQRKPNSFPSLVASIKINQNESLYNKIWKFLREFFGQRKRQDLLENLQNDVDSILEKHVSLPPQSIDHGGGSIRGASEVDPSVYGICPRPEMLMLEGPENLQQSGNKGGEPNSLKDSGACSMPSGQAGKAQAADLKTLSPQLFQEDPLDLKRGTPDVPGSPHPALQKLSQQVSQIEPKSLVRGTADRAQGTSQPDRAQGASQPATPDQNNFADAVLMTVRMNILRAVGREIDVCWQDVFERLDHLDISMKEATSIENQVETSRTQGYKFLQLIGARTTVRQLSDALKESGEVIADDILFGRQAIQRRPRIHPSYSQGDMQGAVGGTPAGGQFRASYEDNQRMNIDPQYRSLPTESNLERKVHKTADGIKDIKIFNSRSSENIDDSSRPDSLESSDSNLTNLMSPGASSDTNGNLPHVVNEEEIPSATASYCGIGQENPSSSMGSVLDSSVGGNQLQSLKEHPAQPATDEGIKHAVLNPDTEYRKLREDAECQSDVLGHNPSSHGYENLHQGEHPRDNTHSAANLTQNNTRLQTPDLDLGTSEEESLRADESDRIEVLRDSNSQRVFNQEGEGLHEGHQLQGEGQSQQQNSNVESVRNLTADTEIDRFEDMDTKSLCEDDQ